MKGVFTGMMLGVAAFSGMAYADTHQPNCVFVGIFTFGIFILAVRML